MYVEAGKMMYHVSMQSNGSSWFGAVIIIQWVVVNFLGLYVQCYVPERSMTYGDIFIWK